MWTILDSLLTITTLANGKPAWLPGAWTVGAALVTIALFARGKWSWSYKETICAIGAAVTATVWLTYGALTGLLAGILSMNIAGLPITIDLWRNPIRGTWPVWGLTVVACIFTLIGSDWSFAGIILPVTSMLYNGFMAWIALFRKTPDQRRNEKTLRYAVFP